MTDLQMHTEMSLDTHAIYIKTSAWGQLRPKQEQALVLGHARCRHPHGTARKGHLQSLLRQ